LDVDDSSVFSNEVRKPQGAMFQEIFFK